MKKRVLIFALAALAFFLATCSNPAAGIPGKSDTPGKSGMPGKTEGYSTFLEEIVINSPEISIRHPVFDSSTDREVAATVEAVQNNSRTNASGPKITSNAHSDDFPGIYFIWDPKQKDPGYLKVDAVLFDILDYFVLTAKQANTYWDFEIFPQSDQKQTADGFYVYYIPKVDNSKNINMVFLGEFKEKAQTTPPTADETSVSQTTLVQKSAMFTLTSAHTGIWRVYSTKTGGTALTDVTASFDAPYLTLTASGNALALGTYYVSVEQTRMFESSRLALTVNSSIEMALVSGGSFRFGQNGDGSSGNVEPVSTVTLTGFYMVKYEVIQAQYLAGI